MHAICFAAQHAIFARRVPVVRHGRQNIELAHMGARAMDILEAPRATEATMHMLAIGVATMLAHVASGVPEVRGLRLDVKGALCVPSVHGSIRASDTCEWIIATEATLRMNSICPATKLSEVALHVPIIRHIGLIWEAATTGRA